MDFYKIITQTTKQGTIEIYPDFIVGRTNDLMVRGKGFYAVWDEEKRMWSTDEYDVARLIDVELWKKKEEVAKTVPTNSIIVKTMCNYNSGSWRQFKNYVQLLPDNAHQLDVDITFANTKVKKRDYRSKKLQYDLQEGDISAYEEIISTLYEPSERAKLEWAIGAIIAGDAKTIQKFMVLYGAPGTGKGTILSIIQQLFEGYYTPFEADELAKSSNAFATEAFRDNPPLAIEFDGDLSKIEKNKTLNTIVSHESVPIKEKFKPVRFEKINSFLMLATNSPVKISDAKSGLLRRLIDVNPSGRKLPPDHYENLMNQIKFELGAIANYCLEKYKDMGKNYYKSYHPVEMVYKTDLFFNFVEDSYQVFADSEYVQLKRAYAMYKEHCEDAGLKYAMNRTQFREALVDYFDEFERVSRIDGQQVRSVYRGFKLSKFEIVEPVKEVHISRMVLKETKSLLDERLKDRPGQLAKEDGSPTDYWKNVKTKLSDVDTNELHWVQPPDNHIVIDFDLKDEDGNKSLELNQAAAEKFPRTYAEYSKGGAGIHLHYIWEGDVSRLSRIYDEDIEVKVFTGDSALRRKLTFCNSEPIAHINSGLPLKGEKKMVNEETVQNEKHLRSVIAKALRKEIHAGTKPNVDFIYKILDDAYNSGMHYDVSDMYNDVFVFANNSSHQSSICIKLVGNMQFKSEEPSEVPQPDKENMKLVFFDVEVFPNLFLINWKYHKAPKETMVRMVNPTAEEVGKLLKHPLVGFNCRRYDNHILYAAYLGFNNKQLYELSQRIIDNDRTALFAEAYGLSYTDVYDFSSKKQSLKKFEIDLGLKHHELGLPWDEPVDESLWQKVSEYCDDDVMATEAVFESRNQDFVAREILAELAGLTVNDTTQKLVGRIIFGTDKNPQRKFNYTNLSKEFPGYEYNRGVSTYRGEVVGEGGYVFAIPGIYWNVGLFDIASMHPTTIKILKLFGEFTPRFVEIMDARLAIKHKNYDAAIEMLEGILKKYLVNVDPEIASALSYALKIAINIVYGLTSAKFENLFKDPRNVDNIVAKRGALFMIDLKHAVQDMGYTVAHIKTDSIKIPNYTEEIKQFVMDFGEKYGYTFEHEATYERMALVNNAVYIAKYSMLDGEPCDKWTATGAQFAHPYVFKSLFSKEKIEFEDMCETKAVKTAIYIDTGNAEEAEALEKEHDRIVRKLKNPKTFDPASRSYLTPEEVDELNNQLVETRTQADNLHEYQFVGKVGAFVPVKPGTGGGRLVRIDKAGEKYHSASGATGFEWMEAERVKSRGDMNIIDKQFFKNLCDDAIDNIAQYGNFEEFAYGEAPFQLPFSESA